MFRLVYVSSLLAASIVLFAPGASFSPQLENLITGRQIAAPVRGAAVLPAIPWCTVNSGTITQTPCTGAVGTGGTSLSANTYSATWWGAENAIPLVPVLPTGCPQAGCGGPAGQEIDTSAAGACRYNL
jgi:hypothetical protein